MFDFFLKIIHPNKTVLADRTIQMMTANVSMLGWISHRTCPEWRLRVEWRQPTLSPSRAIESRTLIVPIVQVEENLGTVRIEAPIPTMAFTFPRTAARRSASLFKYLQQETAQLPEPARAELTRARNAKLKKIENTILQ